MLSLRILPRGIFSFVNNQKQNITPTFRLRLSTKNDSSSSSSSDSSDSESDNEKTKDVGQGATKSEDHLNSLLSKMITKQSVSKTINVAKSKNSQITEVKKNEKEKRMGEKEKFQKKLARAIENVAASMGGDAEQTKKDLMYQNIDPEKGQKKIWFNKKQNDEDAANLMNVLIGMETEEETKTVDPIEEGRAQRAKMYKASFRPRQTPATQQGEKFPLHTESTLNIFKSLDKLKTDQPKCETWDMMEQRELKAMLLTAPRNYFEEMIQWTEKGLIWRFPIDNEQDFRSEDNVHFSEHVFMERHLEGWCPKKGPIRHFMELVCVGLSKNAFLTVEEKIDHIMWYREYFTGKEALLRELGALPEGHAFGKTISDGSKSQPQIEGA